jgi:hypothetical protein
MPASTPIYGFPYPLGTDPVGQGAQDIQDLATAVESQFNLGNEIYTSAVISGQTGSFATNMVFNAATITVPVGKWLVSAGAWILTSGALDTMAVAVWNFTTGSEVTSSRGVPIVPGTSVPQAGYSLPQIVTVNASTVFRPLICRNGSSTPIVQGANSAGAPTAFVRAQRIIF